MMESTCLKVMRQPQVDWSVDCVCSGLCKDGKMTAGGGATEIELARQVAQWAETHPGLEQYSINKFAEALEVIPR